MLTTREEVTIPGIMMEVDGMAPWMMIFLYKQVVNSTSMMIPGV